MVGTTLLHYRILRRLGAGGMGEVYLAEDTKLGREVALKVLPAELADDRDRLLRLEREARAVAALRHPNIVTIHAVEEVDGSRFLAMELVEGHTLDREIPEKGLPVDRLLDLGRQLAGALAAAHERGILHRDLKPANAMIDRDGTLKVLDFGLAKIRAPSSGDEASADGPTELLTREDVLQGTPAYLSPEQARGRPADERSDLFALGIVLYQMATGTRPFDGSSPLETLATILENDPPPLGAVRPDLPEELASLIEACLEKDPARRPESARQVAEALESLDLESGGRTASTRRGSALSPGYRALLGAGLLLLLLGGGIALWLGRTAPTEGPEEETSPAPIRSLAVLPLQNAMADPEKDWFVEGMHDALMIELARLPELEVISRTSVLRFAGSERAIPEIARELGVDGIVEGAVLQVGDEVRITASLIDARSDVQLESWKYDRRLESVLGLIGDVAVAIAHEIELTVTPEQERRMRSPADAAPRAQEALLRGRYQFGRFELEGFRRSREQFRLAAEIEPGLAAAHGWLGAAEGAMAVFGGEGEATAEKAVSAARRALELDPGEAIAHSVLGWMNLYVFRSWSEARRHLSRALELDPDELYALHLWADYLAAADRAEEGLRFLERARRLDPKSRVAQITWISHLYFAGKLERALEEAKSLGDPAMTEWAWQALWGLGRQEEALDVLEDRLLRAEKADEAAAFRGIRESQEPVGAMAWLASEAATGALSPAVGADAFMVAGLHARAGELDEAVSRLSRGADAGMTLVYVLPAIPWVAPLEGRPDFQALMARLGLPVDPPRSDPPG